MPARDYYLPQRRLVSQDDAAIIDRPDVPRSKFTGQWTRTTAFDAGWLVPFLVDEILPGDHMKYDVDAYVRMSTPLFPLFSNQRVDTFFFFVPNRLVWDNWVKFQGEQDNPADTINYTIPITTKGQGYDVGSLGDHMGLPVLPLFPVGFQQFHSALPMRAYNLIWNQWFRDQNIQNSVVVSKGNGPDPFTDYALLRRNKFHDYFTTALPWPQKFTPVNIPLAGQAPVLGLGFVSQTANPGPINPWESNGLATNTYNFYKNLWDPAANNQVVLKASAAAGAIPQVFADLSATTGVSINVLRQAWLVQDLLEKNARGGTRYVEQIRSLFGVTNPDFRLQRPEYIGGGQTTLQLTPIAQTAPSAGVPVGALGAAGTAAGHHSASYAATEHGYIIGLINVRTELAYQQGLHRMWTRSTRLDFYVPPLAGLGEQAILRQELYATGTIGADQTVFGYQERWHEYRTRYNEVTGIMRSGVVGTLDAWHLAQNFGSPPTLSDAFIRDEPPMARVLAAGALAANQQYIANIVIDRQAVRPIPMFGTPISLGRF